MTIIYTETVITYLNDLVDLLYEKEYFGFKESAREYVYLLLMEIKATLHLKQRYKASVYFSRYGRKLYYVSYPRSKQTTWYFFFTEHADDTYVIRYITNNHVSGHLLDD